MRLEFYSHRFAEEVLNAKLGLKREIHDVLTALKISDQKGAHELIQSAFVQAGWKDEEPIAADRRPRYDLYKDRVAIEVEISHRTNTYKDLLKFLVGLNEDKIDLGVEVLWTDNFKRRHSLNSGAPSLGILRSDLTMFREIIPVPIYGIGIED